MDNCLSWQEKLTTSLRKNEREPGARFFQLATVDADGVPHNRTVVLRNFDAEASLIEFVTDNRSEKCVHLNHNAPAAVCWYFVTTREQYRLQCRTKIISSIDDSTKVIEQWKELSEETQTQFYNAAPGKPVSQQVKPLKSNLQYPPEHFVVVQLFVEQADYLNVGTTPHLRRKYVKDSEAVWQMTRIYP